MPDLTDKDERNDRRARRKSKAFRIEDNAPTLTELADAGDFFLKLLNRCQALVKSMFAVMLRVPNELNTEEEQNQRISNAAKLVVQFSWDVKSAASAPYFTKLSEFHPMVDPWRRWDLAWIVECMECQNDRTRLWLPK
ncbi:hypothetical protein IV203_002365 [Nitzschia inconspicua]|uniref:Uncharacterized protein n=1 Tax=Nitzschia inconspicua TaxID=303405 RepID=A0A9K3L8Y1_9STRA|nr:hypothetical protein IV203_002365 [Nitzschia inconspicua]